MEPEYHAEHTLVYRYYGSDLLDKLTSLGFAAYVVPILASIPYYATVENDWLALFGQHLPEWIAPFDERASRLFFEGGDAAVPWGIWWKPLALWTACRVAQERRDHERGSTWHAHSHQSAAQGSAVC